MINDAYVEQKKKKKKKYARQAENLMMKSPSKPDIDVLFWYLFYDSYLSNGIPRKKEMTLPLVYMSQEILLDRYLQREEGRWISPSPARRESISGKYVPVLHNAKHDVSSIHAD